ncbi:PAS domain-containing sensor histidine kinase [Haloarchaeobius sp. HME9146]|uniref:sensor histidine kinase n=1 Tax=Haloarchaeobius sp. HME9146 TaxID=2978732 RepID=UPI0021C12CF3|nr:PAS domain-containing sensor histidine kinase [Haloarchaeobius sp. HME9146]MCT9097318.1 PAS domain-containing sensor histidine kinase [Haloarchaeobius sp. HME9146]
MNTVRVCLADGSGEKWPEQVSATLEDQGSYDVVVTTTLSETLSTLDDDVQCLVVGTTLDGDDGIELLDALAGGVGDTVRVFVADDDEVARDALARDVTEVLTTSTVLDDPDVLVRRLARHVPPGGPATRDPVGAVATALVDASTEATVLTATCETLVRCGACEGAWAIVADGDTSATAGSVTALPADATDRLASAMQQGDDDDSAEVAVSLTSDGELRGVLGLVGSRAIPAKLDALGRVVGHALGQARSMGALQTTERRLQSVLDVLPDVVTIKDRNGRHCYLNEAVDTADGPGSMDVLGKTLPDVIDEATAAEVWATDQRAMETGEPVTSEVSLEVDGTTILFEVVHAPLFDESGAVEGVIDIATDVTDHRLYVERLSALYRGNERLLLAESPTAVAELAVELFADVLDYSLTCVYEFDPQTDELVPQAWSDDLAAVAGEPAPIPRDDGAAWQAFIGDEVRTEVRAVTSSGDRVPWGDFVLPLGRHGVVVVGTTDPTLPPGDEALGKVLATTVETMLDRLDRVQALRDREAELARQNERLEEFASVISHDLRNPLSVAKMYLTLAEEDEELRYITEVGAALDRMNDLVTDVLELARQGRVLGETESLDLAATATMSWSVVDTGDATLSLADDLGTIDADAVRLQQLFENLFRNSVEHGSTSSRAQPGDSVEHGTSEDSADSNQEPLTVRVGRLDDPAVGFFVEDDGVGIPPEDRDRVFERGVTGSSDGTGFGLAIVALIAEAHGWDLDLVSSKEGGARFEIRI